MFLKLLILSKISLYLNFVFSFSDPEKLYDKYITEMTEIFLLEISVYDICQGELNEWIVKCQRTFQLLRNDNDAKNPYRNSLYMDYSAFQQDDVTKCNEKDIIHPRMLEARKQKVLNCYDRPLILSKNSSVQPTTRISIYHGLNDAMMVFTCEMDTCRVLEWFDKTKYNELLQLLPHLSIFRAPVGSTNVGELYELFSSVKNKLNYWCPYENNIIGGLRRILFDKVCDLLYFRENYANRVKYAKKKTDLTSKNEYKVSEITSTVIIGNTSLKCKTLTCNKLRPIRNVNKPLKLMPGLSDDSVILLLPTTDLAYQPVEVVTQLNEYNLLYVDKYF